MESVKTLMELQQQLTQLEKLKQGLESGNVLDIQQGLQTLSKIDDEMAKLAEIEAKMNALKDKILEMKELKAAEALKMQEAAKSKAMSTMSAMKNLKKVKK